MNETEKRRMQLLKNTRKLYHSDYKGNTVHPRYKANESNKAKQRTDEPKSTLGLRICLSLVLFVIYALAERYDESLYFAMTKCIMGK